MTTWQERMAERLKGREVEWARVMGQVHHLHHTSGTCGCGTEPEDQAETDQDYQRRMAQLGRQELARMREHGLPLNLDQVEEVDLVALGESVRETRLDEKLDGLAERRLRDSTYPTTGCSGCDLGTARHWPCTNPNRLVRALESPTPEAAGSPAPTAVDPGRDAHAARSSRRGPDRNKKKTTMEKILAEGRDRIDFEDEE